MTPHLQRFLSRLEGVRKTPSGFKACCPCPGHGDDDRGDDDPSLSIDLGEEDRILINCFGGCTTDSVLEAMGLDFADLWPAPGEPDEADGDVPATTGDPATRVRQVAQQSGSADPTLLDRVYQSLLGKLSLTDAHRRKLKDRGLDDEQIDRLGYRSLTFFALRQKGLVPLRDEFGDDLLRVPGFVKKRGAISVVDLPGGILIPVRDAAGRIVALKIRSDDDKQGSKYLWFSGGGGPSCGSPAHVPLGVTASGLVRVTEGPIKADIAFLRSGLPTIAVAGVSSWAPAIPLLKDLGVETVRLAFDADVLRQEGRRPPVAILRRGARRGWLPGPARALVAGGRQGDRRCPDRRRDDGSPGGRGCHGRHPGDGLRRARGRGGAIAQEDRPSWPPCSSMSSRCRCRTRPARSRRCSQRTRSPCLSRARANSLWRSCPRRSPTSPRTWPRRSAARSITSPSPR